MSYLDSLRQQHFAKSDGLGLVVVPSEKFVDRNPRTWRARAAEYVHEHEQEYEHAVENADENDDTGVCDPWLIGTSWSA